MTIAPTSGFRNAKFIVSATAGFGNYTTIASALTAASSGDTIWIRDGSYTEDLTLKAGVNLCSFESNGALTNLDIPPVNTVPTPAVIIIGKLTATFSGSCQIAGIAFRDNGDYIAAITGTNPTCVFFYGCYFNVQGHDAFNITSSGGGKSGFLYCNISINTASSGSSSLIFTMTGNTRVEFFYSTCYQQAGSVSLSSVAGTGGLELQSSYFGQPIALSSTGAVLGINCTGLVYFTQTGTSDLNLSQCVVGLGGTTQSSVSCGAGCTAELRNCVFNSSNGNALTGAGSITYGGCTFVQTSTTNASSEAYYPLTVKQGGTGASTLTGILTGNGTSAVTANTVTQHGILIGGASNAASSLGVASNGQLAIGSAGADPVLATLTAGTGISITNGAGSITINGSGGGMTWTDNSGTFTAAINNGYFITAASTPTLPASPSEGDRVSFVVDTGSTCTVTGNTGQKIRIGAALSAAAGTAANNAQGDSINLVYRSTGTTWFSIGSPQGTWTVT